ncbi:tetratricopeptide repeat protein [Nitrosomonas sp.]|uniref:tetratricopeptide repeat protein n=1 Tax=Nitrosomonas sp. TaxID=42353 RepID=UPI0020847B68|nr:tetratricopeptide repeat protein [Nitrosomonas sp.]GJL74787.1 MAG: hypothetical protein NMNS02_08930 [Nitrosomonas sp.]
MNIQKIKFIFIAVGLVFLLNAKILSASSICGDLEHQYGPYDYTDPGIRHTLKLVEHNHFTKEVEQLISGVTTSIGGDLAFVLAAFPNHHRALNAMSRLSLRDKTPKPIGASYSALCYFDRAVRFKPNDAMVRSIFSNHLLKINKIDMALEQLLFAVDIEPENPTIHYNLGLLYLKKRNYDKAVYFAKKAYAQDFPLPGLRKQLIALGKWR